MVRETQLRSVLKVISYRVAGTLVTLVVVLACTSRVDLALAAAGIDAAAKILLFLVHERIWDHVHFRRERPTPSVIWLTGLSGSGKSTIASLLVDTLRKRGCKVEYLDGDNLRELLPQSGFTRPEREAHVQRAALLARFLERNGIFTVVALISPYENSRRLARQLCGSFLEVHVSTPLEICEGRDPKGLYARARRGEIKDFTGIDAPYEPPTAPELAIDAGVIEPHNAVALILAKAGVP